MSRPPRRPRRPCARRLRSLGNGLCKLLLGPGLARLRARHDQPVDFRGTLSRKADPERHTFEETTWLTLSYTQNSTPRTWRRQNPSSASYSIGSWKRCPAPAVLTP